MSTVVIVGAGPAGLTAARAAAGRGAEVVVLDSSDAIGGQYWRHLPAARPAARERLLHHHRRTYDALASAVAGHPRIRTLTQAQVWAVERHDDGVRLHLLIGPPDAPGRRGLTLAPDAVVLATGAHDRTLPFPGWQLPGVTTAGAAQSLAKTERIAVGERVIVAGAGPFLLPVAASLLLTGAQVLGVHEASRSPALARGWLREPWRLLAAAGKTGELTGYLAAMVRHRVGYHVGEGVVAARGDGRVEEVVIARLDDSWAPVPGTERTVAADAVCVSHGFTPRLELAVASGCRLGPDRFVEVDGAQRTSVPGVFAAGEITGIGGCDAALAEGRIAGHCAAGGSVGDRELSGALRRRARTSDFAARLEAAHGIRDGWRGWLTDDTLVCRCEEVTAGRLRTICEVTHTADLRSVRLNTRACLGPCQGRICGRTVEDLVGVDHQRSGSGQGGSDRRPIVTPVRLGDLASGPGSHRDAPAMTTAVPPITGPGGTIP